MFGEILREVLDRTALKGVCIHTRGIWLCGVITPLLVHSRGRVSSLSYVDALITLSLLIRHHIQPCLMNASIQPKISLCVYLQMCWLGCLDA